MKLSEELPAVGGGGVFLDLGLECEDGVLDLAFADESQGQLETAFGVFVGVVFVELVVQFALVLFDLWMQRQFLLERLFKLEFVGKKATSLD